VTFYVFFGSGISKKRKKRNPKILSFRIIDFHIATHPHYISLHIGLCMTLVA